MIFERNPLPERAQLTYKQTTGALTVVRLRARTISVLIIILLSVGAVGAYVAFDLALNRGESVCPSNYTAHPFRSQASKSNFSAVTEYLLPSPQRSPNAIAVAPDGSVWFGEESLPAFGHLYTNGTVVEYPWPGPYPPPGAINYSCALRTQIWGVALWNGSVWASDSAGNQLVGLDLTDGEFSHVVMPLPDSFPYTLAVAPDASLWFTELSGQVLARLDSNGTLRQFPVPTGLMGTPDQVYFVNSTYALYADAGEAGENNAGIFAFDPANPVFTQVGTNRLLNSVTGLAVTGTGLWVSEHGPAYVEHYDYSSRTWSNYPTSIDAYGRGAFVYFLLSDSKLVWFNEHFGNRIAQIDPARSSMIEYSVSDPPASNLSTISNAYTIAREGAKVWFTTLTPNSVGFADYSLPPPFDISAPSSNQVVLRQGSNATVGMSIHGHSVSPLSLLFSDSETQTGRPDNITAVSTFPAGGGLEGSGSFSVTLNASPTTPLGSYIFDVTVSDGLTRYTLFLFVTVEQG